MVDGNKLLALLVSLYAEQEGVRIALELEETKCEEKKTA